LNIGVVMGRNVVAGVQLPKQTALLIAARSVA